MDIQEQLNPTTTPSGYTCQRCGWQFPNPNPSLKQRRAHKRICGTVEGFTNTKVIIDDHEAVFDDDDEHHSGDEEIEMTPCHKIENNNIKESCSGAGGIEEKPNRSEDDMFSAATEFSDTGISPGVTSKVFEFPITQSKDADTVHENTMNDSVPLVEERDGSHEDEVIDQMELFDTVQDHGEEFYEVSIGSDMPLVDKAETLLEDFKDLNIALPNISSDDKQAESGSIIDVLEDKPVQESVHKSQTAEHEKSAFEENIVRDNLSEAEASRDKHPGMTLGELIETEIKQAEVDHSVPVLTESAVSSSKDNIKVGISETVVGEGSVKVLTGQDSGVGASFCSSSNSLEGVWGSVSDISEVFGKSERRLDRSYAFYGPSLVESEEEIVEQKASEVNAVKEHKSKSPKAAANEDTITKVTNWSTSGHIATAPLRKLMGEGKSPNPKLSSSLIKKDEEVAESSQPGNSNLTQETPQVNEESPPVRDSGGKLVKKRTTKVISSLVRFVCCSAPVTK